MLKQLSAVLRTSVVFASLVALCSFETASAYQNDEGQSQPSDRDAAPGLRQPGDDVTTELTEANKVTDEKKAESLAAYMEALAAQKSGKLNDALKAFERAEDADPTAAAPVRAHAMLLMRLGRVTQAKAKAETAVELDPNDFETRVQLAVLLLADRSSPKNPIRAVELIEEALASKTLNPKSKEFISIHSVRGRLFIQAQQAAQAAESYQVILDALEKPEDYGLDFREHQKLMTDRATGYETVGRVMLQVGRNDNAERAFAALVRINEDRPDEHHYWLALAQYRKDKLDDAEKNLNLYFDSNKRSSESLRLLSDLYNATSRSDDVVPRLRELAEGTTEGSRVELFIGSLLIEKGDGDGAAKVFNNVIAESGDADAHLGLIQVAIVKRDAALLLENVNKALRARIQIEELFPIRQLILNDPDFGKQVVDACIEALEAKTLNQHPVATFFYSRLADSDSLDLPEQEGKLLQATLDQNPEAALGVEVLSRLGLNQYMRDKYDEAAATFTKLLLLPGLPDGQRVMTLYRLSAAQAENERFDEALTAIDTALKLRPRLPQLMYQQGLIQLQAGQLSESEDTLRKTVGLPNIDTPLAGQTRMLLGSLLTQARRWDDAIANYNDLLKMPDITSSLARRGRSALSNAYVQSGDIKNGEKVLEEVYAETPDDPGVNNDLGYLYAEQNKKLVQAEKMIRIAIAAEPENPAYLDSLGWVLYRLKKFDEALEPLKKATSDPDYRDATIIEHLGDVHKAMDNIDSARKSWQEALDVENASSVPNPEIIERLTEKLSPGDTKE